MDYLTVKQVAELKGCSERYIQRIVQNGKLEAIQELNPDNNCMQYKIPVSALPEELKARYYKRKQQELGLQPELKEPLEQRSKGIKKPVVKKRLDEFTETEREQIALWCGILKEWQAARSKFKNKTEADPLFCGKVKLENPDIDISPDILYRKYKAYRNNDFQGLVENRGGWNKGMTSMDDTIWKIFTRLYLTRSRPAVANCYTKMQAFVMREYPELYAGIPSERTFRRRIKSEIPNAVVQYARFGEKACFDAFIEYAERDYTDLNANDIWIADNHTLDIFSLSMDGKPHRPYLTTFMDAKSGVIVAAIVGDKPCSQSTLLALRAAVIAGYGLPWRVYFDNGSEFLTHDLAGRGHRTKASWNSEDVPPTILSLLGIDMTNAIPRNAKAKNIERFFATLKEWLSKSFESYCGGKPDERPEGVQELVKAKKLPTDAEVQEIVTKIINGSYNAGLYGGKEKQYKDMRRIDVWNESVNSYDVEFRDAATDDLNLLLARTTRYQQIKRNGVYIEYMGRKIWYKDDETVFNVGREVYVRFDPANLNEVRVYDRATDQYLWNYPRADYLNVDYVSDNKDSIAVLQQNIGSSKKAVRKKVAEYTGFEGVELLKAELIKAEQGLQNFEIKRPKAFTPITASELNAEYEGRQNIVSVEFADFKTINDNLSQTKEAKGA